jgi:hypothetical protein
VVESPTQKLAAGLADELRRTLGRKDKLGSRLHPVGVTLHGGDEDLGLPCLDRGWNYTGEAAAVGR